MMLFGMRMWFPSSVTSTVARVFSDRTTPGLAGHRDVVADPERPADAQQHRRDEVLGDVLEREPDGQADDARQPQDREHRVGQVEDREAEAPGPPSTIAELSSEPTTDRSITFLTNGASSVSE